jgi:uncharacterized protein YaiE (UPF0345 family)
LATGSKHYSAFDRTDLSGFDRTTTTFSKNQAFVVPAKASFDIEASADVAYICYYSK